MSWFYPVKSFCISFAFHVKNVINIYLRMPWILLFTVIDIIAENNPSGEFCCTKCNIFLNLTDVWRFRIYLQPILSNNYFSFCTDVDIKSITRRTNQHKSFSYLWHLYLLFNILLRSTKRKHQSRASLALCQGNQLLDPTHKGQLRGM